MAYGTSRALLKCTKCVFAITGAEAYSCMYPKLSYWTLIICTSGQVSCPNQRPLVKILLNPPCACVFTRSVPKPHDTLKHLITTGWSNHKHPTAMQLRSEVMWGNCMKDPVWLILCYRCGEAKSSPQLRDNYTTRRQRFACIFPVQQWPRIKFTHWTVTLTKNKLNKTKQLSASLQISSYSHIYVTSPLTCS